MSITSLKATIHKVRPDLIEHHSPSGVIEGLPIPDDNPIRVSRTREQTNLLDQDYYVLSVGRKSGAIPKCRGCGVYFANRRLHRVQVQALFRHPDSTSKFSVASFCPNVECIEKGNAIDRSAGINYPAFEGKIYVPKDVIFKGVDGEGIEWVYTQ